MSSGDVIVGLVVAAALSFDFTNGFHDTANAMATTIATGALPPKVAVTIAAILNFVGAFISLKVAATIAGGIVDAGAITPTVVFGGLIGAICWNLATWWFGLPSSSSHALIGGVVGATLAAAGTSAVKFDGLVSNVIIPAVASPIVAGLVAAVGVYLVYRMIRRYAPERSERRFRWGQVASSSMVALAHGTNDAQKTMGVISLALIANGSISGGADFHVPEWVVISCATAIALGTYAGGWRIIKTLGTKVVEVRPPQGFGSETVAASVILASSHVGFPLSTTQVVSGAVAGSGVGRPGAVVDWLVARKIVAGWLLTLPSAAAVSAVVYAIIELLGGGVGGAIVVSVAMVVAAFLLWRANRAQPVEPEEAVSEHPAFGTGARPGAGGGMTRLDRRLGQAAAGRVRVGRVRHRRGPDRRARGGRVAALPGPPPRAIEAAPSPSTSSPAHARWPSPAPSRSASTSWRASERLRPSARHRSPASGRHRARRAAHAHRPRRLRRAGGWYMTCSFLTIRFSATARTGWTCRAVQASRRRGLLHYLHVSKVATTERRPPSRAAVYLKVLRTQPITATRCGP